MVDSNFEAEGRSALLFQFDIIECSLDTYCKPIGNTGLAAMYGYV